MRPPEPRQAGTVDSAGLVRTGGVTTPGQLHGTVNALLAAG
jgi:hypothetical protein